MNGTLRWLARWPLALALLLAACLLPATVDAAGAPSTILSSPAKLDLALGARLFDGAGASFPADAEAVPAWLARQRPVAGVNLLGGSYWLYAQLRNDSAVADWIFDPNDTIIDTVEARLIGSDGSIQRLITGYQAPHDYLLHYGKQIALLPGVTYHVLVHYASPYYARKPVFDVEPESDYLRLVNRENFEIIGSLGALLALGLFNFFIYSSTRDRAPLYYALYVLTYATGWGLTFHVGTDLFGLHQLKLHYVPFFLLPVFSTLFYTRFLDLDARFPRLARISRINLVLPLLLLPSCFFALSYAHTLATLVIMLWMVIALVCGVHAWRHGHQPARYFVLAFVALMVPGLIILPANIGLIPAMVDNAQLLTLLGGTLDGLLLAFALADQIRLLRDNLEQQVQERTARLTAANEALRAAKEHAEVVSRHRIDFLSAMSHDIRTPLAGVIGMLKFSLRDQSVRGRTLEYLRIGLRNSESLLAILNDILDFSKIDAGKLTLETVDFDLPELIDEAIGVLQGHADAKSLLLCSDLAPDLPRYVQGDPTRTRQVLVNLLGNAIKFTERGEVRVSARAERIVDGLAHIRLTVSDTGPGIEPDIQQRLFQKFEQADHSTTRRYGGTGLGLAICKELASLMGGTIGVESEPGVGSRFTVRLPLMLGVAPVRRERDLTRERHRHKLRVLCAEDVRTNQIIIGTLLENMGHDVRIVENGVEALCALATADFDLVLMDGRMPVMDGEQATRMIRAGGSAADPVRDAGVPIVALTANASQHDCARYLDAGMDGFLSKPVDEHKLFDQIETIIDSLLARGHALAAADAAPAQLTDIERELALQFGVAPEAPAPARAGGIVIVPLPGLSHKHMARIAQAFLEEAPRRLALARAALEAGDDAALAAAFHALKGSAGYLSSLELHDLARRMEVLAAAGLRAEVDALMPALAQALDIALHDLRAGQGAAQATAPL